VGILPPQEARNPRTVFQLANVPSSNNPPDVPPVAGGFPDAAEPQHRPFLRRRGSASDSDPTIEPAVRTCSRKVASGIEPFQGYSIDDTREPPGHQPQRRWSRPYRLRIQVVIATLRRPKPWLARYYPPGGEERARAFRRKVDAERWLAAQETDQQRGEWTDPRLARTTFGEWEQTYTAARVHLAPSTRATAESLMRSHVLPVFAARPLGSVTKTDVQAFVSELQSSGLAASTVRQCYLLVRGVFTSAVESDLIARSPSRGIHLPKPDQREMRFLDQVEVAALIDAMDPRYSALVAAGAYTGARFGELAALRTSRLDLLRGSMTIVEQLTEVKGQLILRPPKTQASRRQIALPPP